MGALNGINANGEFLKDNEQTTEVWVGVTFAFAATMLDNGLRDEGLQHCQGYL
jgi:non-lysosomal glucosylceramidase